MEESSSNTTEVMVWLNSPGIDRNEYHSLGYRVIDGRSWEVLYTLAHRWRYVVFAAPLATSKAGNNHRSQHQSVRPDPFRRRLRPGQEGS